MTALPDCKPVVLHWSAVKQCGVLVMISVLMLQQMAGDGQGGDDQQAAAAAHIKAFWHDEDDEEEGLHMEDSM